VSDSVSKSELDRRVDFIFDELKKHETTVTKEDIKIIIQLELKYLQHKIMN
jgi:hypothetical protein